MTKYELIAKCAKYTAIVASVFLAGHFGFNVHFDNNSKTSVTNNYSE